MTGVIHSPLTPVTHIMAQRGGGVGPQAPGWVGVGAGGGGGGGGGGGRSQGASASAPGLGAAPPPPPRPGPPARDGESAATFDRGTQVAWGV